MRPSFQLIAFLALFAIAPSTLYAAPASAQRQDSRPEQWRYVLQNGQWWYWMPDNHWVYWRNDRWLDYDARTYSADAMPGPSVDAYYSGPGSANRLDPASDDIRPFYGHAGSAWGAFPSARLGGDVRPFYGHAESNWGVYTPDDTGIGPFYGRAVPMIGYGTSASGASDVGPFYGHAPW